MIGSELVQRKRITKTGKPITVYSAKINYQYTVASNKFTSHQIKWADHNTAEAIQRELASNYPPGTNITVLYNPNKPNVSALQPGLHFTHVLIGLFLLISIATMAFTLYKNARSRK